MEIPYNKIDLSLALLRIDWEKFTPDKIKEFEEEVLAIVPGCKDKAEQNKKVAEYFGITIDKLIDSPNYKVLCNEYKEHLYRTAIKKIQEKFDVAEDEAWALFLKTLGLF